MATGAKKAAAKKTAAEKAVAKKTVAKKAPARKAVAKKAVAKKVGARQAAVVRRTLGNNIQIGHALTNGNSPLTTPQFQNNAVPGGGVIIGPTPGRHNSDMEMFRTVYSIALHGGAIMADVAIRFRTGR